MTYLRAVHNDVERQHNNLKRGSLLDSEYR